MLTPDRPGYTGYIPSSMLAGYDPALYDRYGKRHPYHYYWDGGSQYKVSYDSPGSPILVYQGTERQQLEEAGAVVVQSRDKIGITVVSIPSNVVSPTVTPAATPAPAATPTPEPTQTVRVTTTADGSGAIVFGIVAAALAGLAFGGRRVKRSMSGRRKR